MSQFFQLDNNRTNKFLKKKQQSKSKAVENAKLKQAAIRLQNSIRSFLTRQRLFVSSQNQKQFCFFISKNHIRQHQSRIISLWYNQHSHNNWSETHLLKIIFITLEIMRTKKVQNEEQLLSKMDKTLKKRITHPIFLNKPNIQDLKNWVYFYMFKCYSPIVQQFLVNNSSLQNLLAEILKNKPSILISILCNASNQQFFVFMLDLLYKVQQRQMMEGQLLKQLLRLAYQQQQLEEQVLQIPVINAVSVDFQKVIKVYNRVLKLIKESKLNTVEGCIFGYYLNVLMKAAMAFMKRQIVFKNNIPFVLWKTSEDQFMELIREKDEWNDLIQQFQLEVIELDLLIEMLVKGTKDYLVDLTITYISLRYQSLTLELSKDQFISVIGKLYQIKIYSISTDQKSQRICLMVLTIIDKIFTKQTDKQFLRWFRSDTEFLKSFIQSYLIKVATHSLFCDKRDKPMKDILKLVTSIIENLYDKVFRTRLLQTQIFENKQMTAKFKTFRYKSDSIQQVKAFLANFPFIFPLKIRLYKFKEFIQQDIHNYYETSYINNESVHKDVMIRRGRQFEDAFDSMNDRDMKKNFNIIFINRYGLKEAGIDAGGLSKQFLNRVLKTVLNPVYGMFIENDRKQLLPHPLKAQIKGGHVCKEYEFIGKLIGKALYQGITIGPKFSGPFLNVLRGKKNNFDDLKLIDRDLYKSLSYISEMEQDASQLCLNFQFHDISRNKYISLKRNGSKIPVTNQNKKDYVSLLVDYKVNKLLQYQSRFIRRGLTQVINDDWLLMFNYEELNYLISGSGQINIRQLRIHSRVHGYRPDDQTLKDFWQIAAEMNQQDKSNLLNFVTACPRPSFLGFQDLKPPFTIHKVQNRDMLPVAHTCSNVLDLPDYKNKQVLRSKLLYAIRSDSGYEFA